LSFLLYTLVIVLSVLLRITASDYLICIFKFFLVYTFRISTVL